MTDFPALLPRRSAARVRPGRPADLLAVAIRGLMASAAVLWAVHAPAQEGSQPQPQQQPQATQRLSTPHNSASQRYEINQTFGGQAYAKDNNIWVYDKEFADLFGMPAKYIEDLQGATAAAFRLEVAPFRMCGFAGRDEICGELEYCYFDLYFDESKTPLPWATATTRHDWMPVYGSTRWLRPLDESEKPYGMAAPDTSPEVRRSKASVEPMVPFADPVTKWRAIFTSNQHMDERQPEGSLSDGHAVLGYARNFYKALSIVSLQTGCRSFSRRTISVNLDAREDVFGPVIARFNRVKLPEGYVQRIKSVLAAREQRKTDFYRSLFSAPLGTRIDATGSAQPNR